MISVVAVGHEREERRVISGNLVSTLVDILGRVWSFKRDSPALHVTLMQDYDPWPTEAC